MYTVYHPTYNNCDCGSFEVAYMYKVIILTRNHYTWMYLVVECVLSRTTHHYELRGYWDGPLDLLLNTAPLTTFVLSTGYHDFSLEQLVGDLQSMYIIISSNLSNHLVSCYVQ